MKKFRNILAAGIFLSVFLITDSISTNLTDPNRLFDVNTSLSEKGITYLFELSEKPFFSLEPSSDKRLSLSFAYTEKPDELGTKIEKMPSIYINTTGESENANFILAPDKSYGKIECAWFEEKSIFALNILFNPENKKSEGNNSADTAIKDIRFGFKENGTRMVIGADREPQWIIKSFNNSSLSLVLDASSENIKTKTYYSEKWLRQVEIKEQYDKSSELTINLQSDP